MKNNWSSFKLSLPCTPR